MFVVRIPNRNAKNYYILVPMTNGAAHDTPNAFFFWFDRRVQNSKNVNYTLLRRDTHKTYKI